MERKREGGCNVGARGGGVDDGWMPSVRCVRAHVCMYMYKTCAYACTADAEGVVSCSLAGWDCVCSGKG